MRWQPKVTLQEARAHLGVETQRQWSDEAIVSTTPALLGLFSLVTLLAHRSTRRRELPIRQVAWYQSSAELHRCFSGWAAYVVVPVEFSNIGIQG